MSDDDKQGRDPSNQGDTQPFAREQELRREEEESPLAGCDLDHCRRMHD